MEVIVPLSHSIYFNEVVDHAQHPLNLRGRFVLYRLVHFAKAQSFQRVFLPFAFVNRAFDQCDFYFAHCCKKVSGFQGFRVSRLGFL